MSKYEGETPEFDEMMKDPDFVTLMRRKLFEHDTAASQNTESDAVKQARAMARTKAKSLEAIRKLQQK